MKKSVIITTAMICLAASAVLFAQGAPKSIEAIPVYKGFVPDASGNKTAEGKSVLDASGSYRSFTCRTADLIDVAKWYCGKIGLPFASGEGPGLDWETTVNKGAPGTVSRVKLDLRGPGLEGAENSQDWEGKEKNLAWLKNQWKEKRQKVEGDYVADARFTWTVIEANGDFTDIEMHFSDASFDWHAETSAQLLELKILAKTTMGKKRLLANTSAGAPSEKDLGLPFYPGARYNAKFSRVNQAMMQCLWTSDDSPQTVIAFYEKATELDSNSSGGRYMIQILPSDANPSMTMIQVGPNEKGAMGPGKTMLVITRQKM